MHNIPVSKAAVKAAELVGTMVGKMAGGRVDVKAGWRVDSSVIGWVDCWVGLKEPKWAVMMAESWGTN